MITNSMNQVSLAGKGWGEIYEEMYELGKFHKMDELSQDSCPVANFCLYITLLMEEIATHEYEMTAEQAFSWLYVSVVHRWEAHGKLLTEKGPCKLHTAYTDFLALLVPSDYKTIQGKEARERLYTLFNGNALRTSTMSAVLWQTFLTTGTEATPKPDFCASMAYPWLYKIMPTFYRQDIKPTEPIIRESIFMILPNLLGKFSQPIEIGQK